MTLKSIWSISSLAQQETLNLKPAISNQLCLFRMSFTFKLQSFNNPHMDILQNNPSFSMTFATPARAPYDKLQGISLLLKALSEFFRCLNPLELSSSLQVYPTH